MQYDVYPGDDVEAAIAALAPGDELVAHGGDYPLTGRFSIDLAGTETAPIVIRAADGETPHFDRAYADQNVWDVDHGDWLTLKGLELSGGSAGLRIAAASHLTVEDCHIHDTGDVALRANDSGVYDSLHIVHNELDHTGGTGEGMYLGCNYDECSVANSTIELNWVHDTKGPYVSQGDGIELKEGSHDNVIRDNVVHDTGYPCIITYSTVGEGGPNTVERNVMWGCGDHGIQAAGDVVLRNNVILGSASDGIALQPHQSGSPANVVVENNTVLHANNDAISLRGLTGSVTIANNALYCQYGTALDVVNGDTSQLVLTGNVGDDGSASGSVAPGDLTADLVAANYGGAPPNDVFPAPGGALVGAGDAAWLPPDDFNGVARTAADAGAYAFDPAGNPGWTIQAGFKELVAATETDADTDSDTDADSDADSDADTDADSDADTTIGGSTSSSSTGGPKDGGGCSCGGGGGGPWTGLLLLLGLLRRR